MNKSFFLKIVNPLLFLMFLSQALTGILNEIVRGISQPAFELIHGTGGYILVTLIVIHLYLNWNWVKNFIHSFYKK